MTIAHGRTTNTDTRDDDDVADAKRGEDGGQATSIETRKRCEDGEKCVQDKTKTVGTSRTLRAANDGKVLVLPFIIFHTTADDSEPSILDMPMPTMKACRTQHRRVF